MTPEQRPEIWDRAGEFARFLASPDAEPPGPFLWHLWAHLHQDEGIPSRDAQDTIAAAGRECASLLRNVGWLEQPDTETQASYLLYPHAKNGNAIGSWHMRALAAILSGASTGETLDRLRHSGTAVSFHSIEAMRSEVDALLPLPDDVPALPAGILYDPDHQYPYMDLARVPLEQTGVLFDEMNARLSGVMATYGGINADVLYAIARQTDHPDVASIYEYEELCGPADEALGLRMPHAWYFNMRQPMEAALWYNYLQTRKYWKRPKKNEAFRQTYGVVGLVECYAIENLLRFAHQRGVEAMSSPYDLMLTAEYLARGKPEWLAQDGGFLAFKDHVLAATGNQGWFEMPNPNERLQEAIAILRSYWQSVLAHRAISLTDAEIIIHDPWGLLGELGFFYIREPSVVIIGGNADKRMPTEPEEEIVARNVRLALMQYPPDTKLVVPWYYDPHEGASPWVLSLHAEPKSDLTPDAFILGLIGMNAMLDARVHDDFRTRYETLAGQVDKQLARNIQYGL